MLRKKEVYTHITPIPSYIPRQLAIDILHSHGEIITLNPLVLEHHPIKAPRDSAADEYYATWYEIVERIQYIPGMGKLGSGKISFKGCFHDMPWGLQTHIYTPMNIEIRNNWRVAGNQPGEPPEARELGLGAPNDGLYLREDIEIKCNMALVAFVKTQLKAATKILVERLIKKAELLDAGVLHAMFEDGKLKTVNPADRSSAIPSPRGQYNPVNRPVSPYAHNSAMPYGAEQAGQGRYPAATKYANDQPPAAIMELPGDYVHASGPAHLNPSGSPALDRYSSVSSRSDYSPNSTHPSAAGARWSDYSASSRPVSYATTVATEPLRSPPPDKHHSFAQELSAHAETREEHNSDHAAALKRLEASERNSPHPSPRLQQQQQYADQPPRYRYNPQDYADMKS